MSDQRPTAHDDGVLLSRYLAGETDEVTSARIERRLATEPALAAQLDALADALVRLGAIDDVPTPDGYQTRLRERLAGARRGNAEDAPAGDADGGSGRAAGRRRPVASRWRPLVAAAAVVAMAVVGVSTVWSTGASETEDSGAVEAVREAAEAGDAEALAGEEQPAPPDEADAADDVAPAERRAGADAQALEQEASAASEAALAVPDVPDDELLERLRAQLDRGRDPIARERRLRDQAALPTGPLCARALDALAVDVVARDGRPTLALLRGPGQAPVLALVDPATCEVRDTGRP